MDPLLLKKDELEYELAIRQIIGKETQRTKTAALRIHLEAERRGIYDKPYTPFASSTSEIQTTEKICNALTMSLEEAIATGNNLLLYEISSRVEHLVNRCKRIIPVFAHEQRGLSVVKSKVNDLKRKVDKYRSEDGDYDLAIDDPRGARATSDLSITQDEFNQIHNAQGTFPEWSFFQNIRPNRWDLLPWLKNMVVSRE